MDTKGCVTPTKQGTEGTTTHIPDQTLRDYTRAFSDILVVTITVYDRCPISTQGNEDSSITLSLLH